ncbi:tripartite tricarboxylate transporter permease [Natrialba swarupiae]|uniref:tripartite tricarboxylate transporter permease n=1 Tax=Natrialba swarupiae TaxID=2448032 RepID=UPI001391D5D4|nr:tripartite tricarboxylate transporter permease [Natrialba swarupiae]
MAALEMLLDPTVMLYIVLGTLIGMVIGVIPGLGGVVALTLLIPLTYGLDPIAALAFLAAAKGGVTFSGSITAILLNIPGSPVNTATLLDGHPMAQKGEGNVAIGASAVASALGAVLGVIILVLLLPFIRPLMVMFGPPEFFILTIVGLVAISVAVKGAILSGLVGACFGLLIAFHGFNPVTGSARFTFDIQYLYDGFNIIPVIIGLFAIAEAIKLMGQDQIATDDADIQFGEGRLAGGLAVFRNKILFVQSAMIGLLVGAIPAVGGVIAGFISYIQGKNISSHPEKFGTGWIEGVISTEAANDAKDAGDLVPTLALGIPGSASAAILLGAFILHGLQPGPRFLIDHIDIAYAIFFALIIANIISSVLGLALLKPLTRLTQLDTGTIVMGILCLSIPGAYAINNNPTDMLIALLFGVIGYVFIRANISRIAFIIAMILGPIAENAYHQSLMTSRGSHMIFLERPISLGLIVLAVAFTLLPLIYTSVKQYRVPT